MDVVTRWLATRTFHHGEFAEIASLMRQKEALGLSLSLCIPTLNEAATIGAVVTQLHSALREQIPLLDEIAVIDSGSTDRTVKLAAAAGASVYRAADILPEMGNQCGKGENLWKALCQLKGDILIFLDADITNMHPRFVTGLVGPLLRHPEIGYVKSFYERPSCLHGEKCLLGGGRVTEILIRPLFSLYFPELTAFIQPLAGEYAARRTLLESLAFPVGYGVEAAHLIDLHARHGLDIFAQTDMGQRCHRSRGNPELGRMACAILQVLARRLRARGYWCGPAEGEECLLRQFGWYQGTYQQEIRSIVEPERPPMREVAAYRRQRGWGPVGHDPRPMEVESIVQRPATVVED
jgi:glucosyl-3-phosphoglycerate synthase